MLTLKKIKTAFQIVMWVYVAITSALGLIDMVRDSIWYFKDKAAERRANLEK